MRGSMLTDARSKPNLTDRDALACPQCGDQMKVIAFIEPPQGDVIEKILRHCGLWHAATPRPPPATDGWVHDPDGDADCHTAASDERLPSQGEQRTACLIGHPGGHATPNINAFDEQLILPSFGIERDCSHFLTEERMQRIFNSDGARIAGII